MKFNPHIVSVLVLIMIIGPWFLFDSVVVAFNAIGWLCALCAIWTNEFSERKFRAYLHDRGYK